MSGVAMNARPGVVTWFKVYAGILCILYLFLAFGAFFFIADPTDVDLSPELAKVMGWVALVMGLGLFAACLLPLVMSPRPWLWIYDIVIICLGMTSACFIPICVPLLIFWLKPEVKLYFGRPTM